METNFKQLYQGDAEEILKTFPDNCIDLVVTSPPYDNLRHYNNSLDSSSWNHEKFKAIALQLIRTLKDGGVIVWNVNDKVENGSKSGTSLRQALFFIDNGLNYNDMMIWKKTNAMPQVRQPRYTQCHEPMFIFSKGKPKTFNPIMRQTKSGGKQYHSTGKKMGGENGRRELNYVVNTEMVDYNVWELPVAQNKTLYNVNGKDIKHPAVFPYVLPYRHIQSWTNEGDVVLDPFAGSGTTLIAAKDLGRIPVGIECNPDYCGIIMQRLGNAEEKNKNEPKMFRYQLDLENVPTIGNFKLN